MTSLIESKNRILGFDSICGENYIQLAPNPNLPKPSWMVLGKWGEDFFHSGKYIDVLDNKPTNKNLAN